MKLLSTRFSSYRSLLPILGVALTYHGGLLFFTFKRTYDAYVHIFFADHYRRTWFDHWEPRWYTGFTITSYPPASHQLIALLSNLWGLEIGFILVQWFAVLLTTIGIYRFSRIWVGHTVALIATILFVFSSSVAETIHVFGQLPTTLSLGFLLNALPYLYRWLHQGQWRYLFFAWAFNAATTATHHVTTLFGAVFFVAPVIAFAIVEVVVQAELPPLRLWERKHLRPILARTFQLTLPLLVRALLYGVGLILLLIFIVLPYWLWSRSDPITQVSIPHASRDSFLQNLPAGLIFWLIPYGFSLLGVPYALYKGFTTKHWPLGGSLLLLFVLGTGGTTPLPRLILGGAFDILTLDRFTFWATIVILPFLGLFVESWLWGRVGQTIINIGGRPFWHTLSLGLALAVMLFSVFTANLSQFRRFQPEPIAMQSIVAFLEKDQHWRWRYLTLGFGDQMAWLSAQTTANSAEGNYHSARRLPELTTSSVERLDGAKFRGISGIGSLQQFLAVPEKYNLKYIFSNDAFYDPLLYFSGWHQVGRLENNIIVWEREDIPPLPEVLPRQEIPMWQRLFWGTLPLTAISAALIAVLCDLSGFTLRPSHRRYGAIPTRLGRWLARHGEIPPTTKSLPVTSLFPRFPFRRPPLALWRVITLFTLLLTLTITGYWVYNHRQPTPERVLLTYYDALDFRRFTEAYNQLNPATRGSFEQFMLTLSVQGGLLASYAKLEAVQFTIAQQEESYMEVVAHTDWITSLTRYQYDQTHILRQLDGQWYLDPVSADADAPPDQFFRQPIIAWRNQARKQITTESTAFGDIQDRPEITILSSRFVQHQGQNYIVGELLNTDADPADLTVTALLYDQDDAVRLWFNAQTAIIHKLLPKETTPFRIDFEGVVTTTAAFDPHAFTSPELDLKTIARYAVYGKAVVTGYDLERFVGVQNMRILSDDNGRFLLEGEAINYGTTEATIPHLLISYYDEKGVVWVDDYYLESAIRPQRRLHFSVPLTSADALTILPIQGRAYTNILDDANSDQLNRAEQDSAERIKLPSQLGFNDVKVKIHYFAQP